MAIRKKKVVGADEPQPVELSPAQGPVVKTAPVPPPSLAAQGQTDEQFLAALFPVGQIVLLVADSSPVRDIFGAFLRAYGCETLQYDTLALSQLKGTLVAMQKRVTNEHVSVVLLGLYQPNEPSLDVAHVIGSSVITMFADRVVLIRDGQALVIKDRNGPLQTLTLPATLKS